PGDRPPGPPPLAREPAGAPPGRGGAGPRPRRLVRGRPAPGGRAAAPRRVAGAWHRPLVAPGQQLPAPHRDRARPGVPRHGEADRVSRSRRGPAGRHRGGRGAHPAASPSPLELRERERWAGGPDAVHGADHRRGGHLDPVAGRRPRPALGARRTALPSRRLRGGMMRKTCPFVLLALVIPAPTWAAAAPPRPPRTMRLDYYHTGSAGEERFSLDRVVV